MFETWTTSAFYSMYTATSRNMSKHILAGNYLFCTFRAVKVYLGLRLEGISKVFKVSQRQEDDEMDKMVGKILSPVEVMPRPSDEKFGDHKHIKASSKYQLFYNQFPALNQIALS